MARSIPWQILMVDDDEDLTRQVKEYLETNLISENEPIQVITQNDFNRAIIDLAERRIDLVILDVRLGPVDLDPEPDLDEAGEQVLNKIKEEKFVPVVFFTALPNRVKHLESSLVGVVQKGSPTQLHDLLDSLNSIFSTPLPSVNRALISHLEAVQRDYMWNFVSDHWSDFGAVNSHTELAYLLGRRLAISLSQTGIKQLLGAFPNQQNDIPVNGLIHPAQYYIMPSVETNPLAGDLYRTTTENTETYWILLTPSCDLVEGRSRQNAEQVLLAQCLPLENQNEYLRWRECCLQCIGEKPNPSKDTIDRHNSAQKKLSSLLKNNRQNSQSERYLFLPGVLGLPDLVVDFQGLCSKKREYLNDLERVASLDSPFSEEILYRFARYYGRLGTPDLHVDSVLGKLRSCIK